MNWTKALITAYNLLSYHNPFTCKSSHFPLNLFTEIQSALDPNLFTLGEGIHSECMKTSHYLNTTHLHAKSHTHTHTLECDTACCHGRWQKKISPVYQLRWIILIVSCFDCRLILLPALIDLKVKKYIAVLSKWNEEKYKCMSRMKHHSVYPIIRLSNHER